MFGLITKPLAILTTTTNHDFFDWKFWLKSNPIVYQSKKSLSYFGQVVFDMSDLTCGLFD
jgi:hypothetical protein